MNPDLKVTYFFRKPAPSFYSIERLFNTVMGHLQRTVPEKVFLPFHTGEGIGAILRNCWYARRKQGRVNHITGEVYYVALALRKQATVLTIHDLESLGSQNKLKNYFLQRFWLHLPAKRAHYVTVVSEYSKRKLLAATGIAENKVVVIPNCIDFTDADFQPKSEINRHEPVLLQVGTKSNKNLENLVMAIANLPCRLIIIGKLSPEQKRLLNSNHIQYEQHQEIVYEQVKQLYYKADIVTFVSTFEGFGLPILEAHALGRPVITSTTTAMPEVAGDAALLVDPFNPAEIREAIVRLIADDALRNNLVKAGYENVQGFKPAAVAAMYEQLYERILEECR